MEKVGDSINQCIYVMTISSLFLSSVTNFLEKPKPEQTTSDRAVPPLYLFSRKDRHLLEQFVTKGIGY